MMLLFLVADFWTMGERGWILWQVVNQFEYLSAYSRFREAGLEHCWVVMRHTLASSRQGLRVSRQTKQIWCRVGRAAKTSLKVHENAYQATAVLCLKVQEDKRSERRHNIRRQLLTAQVWIRQMLVKQN